MASRPLHSAAIFFPLGAIRIATGFYETKVSWKDAFQAWRDSQDEGNSLAILFSDASYHSGLVFRWGIVDSFELLEPGTIIRFSQIRSLPNLAATGLIKIKDGTPIAEGLRRGHVMVRTPAFLDDMATSDDLDGSMGGSNARDYRPDSSGAVPDDPIALEAVWRQVRGHQTAFREALVELYDARCAITGCDIDCVLEAAHIAPHAQTGDNSMDNGLLLRADLHILFDEGLLGIEPGSLEVALAPELSDSIYKDLAGTSLRARTDGSRPGRAVLAARWKAAKLG